MLNPTTPCQAKMRTASHRLAFGLCFFIIPFSRLDKILALPRMASQNETIPGLTKLCRASQKSFL
ncbi:MAG: hypothetical protein GY896_22765 [Gammaproteobacteria bacterium]|nr:hypothetical protein [Gammaproteobacteria bacterium]